MTSPTPTQQLADVIATGNPRKIAAEIDRLIAHRIYRATGKVAPEPVVQHSRTLMTYGD